MKVVLICSKLVRYFLRGRNNKAINSNQFLDYNLTTRLVVYLQNILKDLELIFCDLFIIWQYFFDIFPLCVWEGGLIKETGQEFIASCYQLPLIPGRGIMIGISSENWKLCLTCLAGFSDLFEFLFNCAVQNYHILLPSPKTYCLSSSYQLFFKLDGTFVISWCNLMYNRNSRTSQNWFLAWIRMCFLL